MIFSILDEFTREHPIPNGFNMSMIEFNRHRFKTGGAFNLDFKIDKLSLENTTIVPIHKSTFLANSTFFKNNGEVCYFVHLNKSPADYLELFDLGMNFWLNYLDNDIIQLARDKQIKIILSILVETSELDCFRKIIKNVKNFFGHLDSFQIWTCYGPPSIKVYKDHYSTGKDEFFVKHDNYYSQIKEHDPVVEIPYWECKAYEIYKFQNLKLPKTKKYVSLCRRYSKERLLTHCYLLANNLLDDGFNSIPGTCTVNKISLAYAVARISNKNFFEKEVQESLDFWKNNPQGIILDEEPLTDEGRTMYSKNYLGFSSEPELEKYYAQTSMSLVQEGHLESTTYMLTEKIFRSILYKHMFIMVGSPGLLMALKDRGYKTFSSLWPEDYDLILDENLRCKAALDLFKEIITRKDFSELYEKALPIVEFNHNHMLNRIKQYREKYSK